MNKTAKPLKSMQTERRESRYNQKESRERFERAVDIAVATKPLHRPARKRAAQKRP